MSFRKLLPAALVGLAWFGLQGSAAAAGMDLVPDGKITAKEVRSLIVEASGATKTRGLKPKVAAINVGQVKIRAASCAKASDWKTFTVSSSSTRGTLCNGDVRFNHTKRRGRKYFQHTMRLILNHILAEANLKKWGAGQVASIGSNGKVANLYFWKRGKPGSPSKMLRVKGSKVTVKDLNPAK